MAQEEADHFALLELVWRGPDEAAAAAVAAFAGDINRASLGDAGGRFRGYTVLAAAAVVPLRMVHSRSVTLNALAARGDVDIYRCEPLKVIAWHAPALRAFLHAFPAINSDACTEALHAACELAGAIHTDAPRLLLDAGATVTPACLALAQRNAELAAVLQPHADWAAGLRRCWMQACVVHVL